MQRRLTTAHRQARRIRVLAYARSTFPKTTVSMFAVKYGIRVCLTISYHLIQHKTVLDNSQASLPGYYPCLMSYSHQARTEDVLDVSMA